MDRRLRTTLEPVINFGLNMLDFRVVYDESTTCQISYPLTQKGKLHESISFCPTPSLLVRSHIGSCGDICLPPCRNRCSLHEALQSGALCNRQPRLDHYCSIAPDCDGLVESCRIQVTR